MINACIDMIDVNSKKGNYWSIAAIILTNYFSTPKTYINIPSKVLYYFVFDF